jgi:hypothetical protein
MKIRLWQLVAVTIIAFGGPMAVSAPAYAGGPVNITSWCRWYYNSNAFNAITVANNVYGWRCQYGTDTGTQLNVDMNSACAHQYGNPGTARYTNYYDKYSWYCV